MPTIPIADVRITSYHPGLGKTGDHRSPHPWHELVYLEAGSYSLSTPQDTHRLAPGSLAVIPAGTEHGPRTPQDLGTRLWVLQWTGWKPAAWVGPMVLSDPDRRILTALAWMRDRQDDGPDSAGDGGGFLECQALALLHDLECRRRGCFSGADAVARAREILRHRPQNRWTLYELAQRVGMSPEHLCRRFSRRYGAAPLAWVTRLRVERALALLRTGPLTLAEIAPTVGFASASGLAKAIKRLTGTTARAIRGGAATR